MEGREERREGGRVGGRVGGRQGGRECKDRKSGGRGPETRSEPSAVERAPLRAAGAGPGNGGSAARAQEAFEGGRGNQKIPEERGRWGRPGPGQPGQEPGAVGACSRGQQQSSAATRKVRSSGRPRSGSDKATQKGKRRLRSWSPAATDSEQMVNTSRPRRWRVAPRRRAGRRRR